MNIHSDTGKVIALQKGHPILYSSLMSVKAGTIRTPLREKKGPEKAQRGKSDKRKREEMRATNTLTGSSWKMKNNRKIKEEII